LWCTGVALAGINASANTAAVTTVTIVFIAFLQRPAKGFVPRPHTNRQSSFPSTHALMGNSVRFGSLADICSEKRHVGFAPK
jgi:hypothetical protein